MSDVAQLLADWAVQLQPTKSDLALADRALVDVVAVALAARDDAIRGVAATLPEVGQWTTFGHVLDFDDLHMPSTTHISVVCVPVALAAGGDARAYLAGAGVMARLGTALGWSHYAEGWHATCTAGAPAAAVTASVALGLDAEATARAIALAIPAAGGVQRAFGTQAKSLQVGFAAAAGLRGAQLAAAGASADTSAVGEWLRLVGGDAGFLDVTGPAVPGGLAIKLHPCCYAMQRPIAAMREVNVDANDVARVAVRTPTATVQPLLHARPRTGLEGKFSLEYAVAAALLDDFPGFDSFTDAAVARPEAVRLVEAVEVELTPGGDGLLVGTCTVEITRRDGSVVSTELAVPPGGPARPPSDLELAAKVRTCVGDLAGEVTGVRWDSAAALLRSLLPEPAHSTRV